MQEVDKEIVMRSLASVGMEAYAERTMDKMSEDVYKRQILSLPIWKALERMELMHKLSLRLRLLIFYVPN